MFFLEINKGPTEKNQRKTRELVKKAPKIFQKQNNVPDIPASNQGSDILVHIINNCCIINLPLFSTVVPAVIFVFCPVGLSLL